MTAVAKFEKESTRLTILEVAAAEIHRNGFRSTGLNDILSKTNLTKGAFYHHFKSKAELGLAVAKEIVDTKIRAMWITPLAKDDANIDTLTSILEYAMAANNQTLASLGCPLCNLAQEMATQDDKICEVLRCTIEDWRKQIVTLLKNDQSRGLVRENVDCEQSSYFILSSLQGAIGLAKPYHSPTPFRAALRGLLDYIQGLKIQGIKA